MKWLAFLLLILNAGIWYFSGSLQPPGRSEATAGGSLPRVASLKYSQTVAEPPALEPSTLEPPVSEPIAPEAATPEVVEAQVAAADPQETGPVEQAGPLEESTDPEAEVVPEFCVRMGWVDSLEVAQGLIANQPLAEEVGLALEKEERELPPYHWVIIPPQPRSVALKQFRDIQRQGIDSYLVTEGENRNAISLGLFESHRAAISVLEEKKRQNLNVVLANFPRNQISYALVFEAEPELVEELVKAVRADYGSKFDFLEINPCEGVATPKKNP